jgi:hypothetical protein
MTLRTTVGKGSCRIRLRNRNLRDRRLYNALANIYWRQRDAAAIDRRCGPGHQPCALRSATRYYPARLTACACNLTRSPRTRSLYQPAGQAPESRQSIPPRRSAVPESKLQRRAATAAQGRSQQSGGTRAAARDAVPGPPVLFLASAHPRPLSLSGHPCRQAGTNRRVFPATAWAIPATGFVQRDLLGLSAPWGAGCARAPSQAPDKSYISGGPSRQVSSMVDWRTVSTPINHALGSGDSSGQVTPPTRARTGSDRT